MFRDRTNLYLSYRRTIPRPAKSPQARTIAIAEEEESLMSHRPLTGNRGNGSDNGKGMESIEMKPLAPSIFDISQSLDETLASIKLRTNDLSSLYKKLLITRDNEKPALEKSIEELNYNITKMFEACYVPIKKLEFLQKNHVRLKLKYTPDELIIIENYKKLYAVRIQESLLVFRNLQNNYIKFLRDDDFDNDDDTRQLLSASGTGTGIGIGTASSNQVALLEENSSNIESYSRQALQQAQQQIQNNPNSLILASREREISKLAMGILEISTIFKEMETLVVDQGSMLDRIDYNLAQAVEDLKQSDKELIKAQGYQKRTTKCKIIFLLSLIVLALFIIVVMKPHGKTTVVEKPVEHTTPPDSGEN